MLATTTNRRAPNYTVRLPRLHSAQLAIKRGAARFNVLRAGRRFGKDILLVDMAADAALHGKPVAWFAPTYAMLVHDWEMIDNLLSTVIQRRSQQEKSMRLITGGVLDFWSLDSENTARGRKYGLAIINEAAFAPRLLNTWNMVIRPTLADLKGGAWLSGTPKGLNDYYTLHQQALTDSEWATFHYSTYDNPHIDRAEIEAMKRSMPERVFQQEIMAQFLEDGAGVFRGVRAAAIALQQDEPIAGHEYVIGVDWARTDDATVFAVVDVTGKALVYLDRMNNTDYATQRARLIALAGRFHVGVILAEYNSMGGPQVEALQAAGLPVQAFTTTNASKAQIIEGLALAFEQQAVTIIDDPVLTGELMAYQSERLPSGLVRYNAPSGMHDDTVIALALAWYAGNRQGAGVDWA